MSQQNGNVNRVGAQDRVGASGGMEHSFGFKAVDENESRGWSTTFSIRLPKRYDIMNDLMSAGMHRVWKDAMVAWLAPSKRPGWTSLDVAGGTGDIAFRIVEASGRQAHVTILDIRHGRCSASGVNAPSRRASSTILNSSRPMRRNCRSRTIVSMPIRSPSAFAMCRISTRR